MLTLEDIKKQYPHLNEEDCMEMQMLKNEALERDRQTEELSSNFARFVSDKKFGLWTRKDVRRVGLETHVILTGAGLPRVEIEYRNERCLVYYGREAKILTGSQVRAMFR